MPYSVEVHLINSSLQLDTLTGSSTCLSNNDLLQLNSKKTTEWNKVNQINQNIATYYLWGADTSSSCFLSYMEKKETYGEKYNLLGFYYYSEGVYSAFTGEQLVQLIFLYEMMEMHNLI